MPRPESPEIPTTIGRHGIIVPKFSYFTDRETGLATGRSFRMWAESLVDANEPLPRDSYDRTVPYDKQIVIPADSQNPLTIIKAAYMWGHNPSAIRRSKYEMEDDWGDIHGVVRGFGRSQRGTVNEFMIATPPVELGRSMSLFVLARYEQSADPNYGGDEFLNFKGARVETDAARAHFAQHGYVEGWHGDSYETISPEIENVARATLELLGVEPTIN